MTPRLAERRSLCWRLSFRAETADNSILLEYAGDLVMDLPEESALEVIGSGPHLPESLNARPEPPVFVDRHVSESQGNTGKPRPGFPCGKRRYPGEVGVHGAAAGTASRTTLRRISSGFGVAGVQKVSCACAALARASAMQTAASVRVVTVSPFVLAERRSGTGLIVV